MFRKDDIKKIEIVFKKRGLWFLFIGKLLPAIKVFIPIPAALGRVSRWKFSGIMFAASWIWSFGFIGIGYFFGKNAGLWKSYGIILAVVAFGLMFSFYRYMNSKAIIAELSREA